MEIPDLLKQLLERLPDGAAKDVASENQDTAVALLQRLELDKVSPDALPIVAELASKLGQGQLACAALERSVEASRANLAGYLSLSDAYESIGAATDAAICAHEALRLGAILPERFAERLKRLGVDAADPEAAAYAARAQMAPSKRLLPGRKRILVITNLFPPQELGGYGRKIWEFANELRLRGHEIKVLAGDAPYLWKEPRAEEAVLEPYVSRSLGLYGAWANGAVSMIPDRERAAEMARENALLAVEAADAFGPDFCLMGNLDLIGHLAIDQFTLRGIPVVQCLGNEYAGWPEDYVPDWELFVAGPASHFLREKLAGKGFRMDRYEVLYPGARTDFFYRHFMPRRDIPRIAFAGLLMQYKGAQTLVEALRLLKEGGLEFRATIAGDSTDRAFVDGLKAKVAEAGMAEWIQFPGFLDRDGLRGLFATHNVLVFPSIVDEAFGISHVEAMASGLTVISSLTGGAKEIIRPGEDGLAFAPGDAVGLAKRIAELVADPALWKRLAYAGRERSLSFSIPSTVDRIERLFQSMELE